MMPLDWLLQGDPSIRWQALRDLTDAPAADVAAERTQVATVGWGARLLAAPGRRRVLAWRVMEVEGERPPYMS